jgi:L-alanine-DL-glutamate epimerase-like enolase superfamily enzyme
MAYAISAVDCALWDLKARLLDLPLHRLLGAVRADVPLYGSGGFTTYDADQMRRQLTGWAHEQDIPRVKIKIAESAGTRVERDLDRMRQAREVIGPDVELFVDANGGYRAKQAVRVMQMADGLDIRWFEEPVDSANHAGLREVRDRVDADVAGGEYGTSLLYYQRLCSADALDCIQADVSRCGGITMWQRTGSSSPRTAPPTSAPMSPQRLRGSAISSGSTTMSAWSAGSSTAVSTRAAVRSRRQMYPATA